MNLIEYIYTQRAWSQRTFGPATRENDRTLGILEHIRKELEEVKAKPSDASEWADLIILAIDGAWRNKIRPRDLCDALEAKQERNMARKWPDWRTISPTKAIEHDRSDDATT